MCPVTSTSREDRVSALEASNLFDELWPICRSISGPGLRQTLAILAREMNLEVYLWSPVRDRSLRLGSPT